MIAAARIARRQEAEPAPRRDPVAAALFYRMDWCEQHPGLMLACLGAVILAGSALQGLMP